MNNKKNILIFLFVYFSIRIFSYFFTPLTPLWVSDPINTLISVWLLFLAIFWIIKKDEWGWYIVAGEIILAGSGGYLQIAGLSLRTALLFTSLSVYFIKRIYKEQKLFFHSFKTEHFIIFTLIIIASLAAIRGLYLGHDQTTVLADLIPYFFSLYYFPLSELWMSEKFRSFSKSALVATIIGNTLFILFTQFAFSSGIFILQDHYYHWYRDVALGKITAVNFNFYRLVLNEHLLLIPISLYFIADIIKNKANKLNIFLLTCTLFILANNLTRIYLLAIFVGTLILFSIKNWKKWLKVSVLSAFSFVLIFTTTHTIVSRGQSFGLEIFGLRIQSIASPQIEESSLSRLLLLPKIWQKITSHPIIGNGLGDSVTVFSPVFNSEITTPHFDWGYLEIWAETGLLGMMIWIVFILYLLYTIIKNKQGYNKQILLAMLISLLIINLTSPALFHVFGIILSIIFFTPFGLNISRSAGGIIMGSDKKIVLVNSQKRPDWWTPPKGRINENENPIDAAKREIFEESGLKNIEYIKNLGDFYNLLSWDGKPYFKKNTMFLFSTNETKLKPQDSDNPLAKWFTIDEAIEITKNKYYKEFLIKIKHDLT